MFVYTIYQVNKHVANSVQIMRSISNLAMVVFVTKMICRQYQSAETIPEGIQVKSNLVSEIGQAKPFGSQQCFYLPTYGHVLSCLSSSSELLRLPNFLHIT